mmetsp:Transcript_9224/g.23378  ORF Transcript_9224/g.23378 Transcript_9224/m.23378 type:complete len:263 (-) Transcript_9224:1254-2042(-)
MRQSAPVASSATTSLSGRLTRTSEPATASGAGSARAHARSCGGSARPPRSSAGSACHEPYQSPSSHMGGSASSPPTPASGECSPRCSHSASATALSTSNAQKIESGLRAGKQAQCAPIAASAREGSRRPTEAKVAETRRSDEARKRCPNAAGPVGVPPGVAARREVAPRLVGMGERAPLFPAARPGRVWLGERPRSGGRACACDARKSSPSKKGTAGGCAARMYPSTYAWLSSGTSCSASCESMSSRHSLINTSAHVNHSAT